jgi:hypothetical protein
VYTPKTRLRGTVDADVPAAGFPQHHRPNGLNLIVIPEMAASFRVLPKPMVVI